MGDLSPRNKGYMGDFSPKYGGYMGDFSPDIKGYMGDFSPKYGGYMGDFSPKYGGYMGDLSPIWLYLVWETRNTGKVLNHACQSTAMEGGVEKLMQRKPRVMD